MGPGLRTIFVSLFLLTERLSGYVIVGQLRDIAEHGCDEVLRCGCATEVTGPHTHGERQFKGRDEVRGGCRVPEMFEHHGAAPDLTNRIRDTFSGDIGSGAVHGLEHGRMPSFGIEVGARSHSD